MRLQSLILWYSDIRPDVSQYILSYFVLTVFNIKLKLSDIQSF
jgi:hypothetical protein